MRLGCEGQDRGGVTKRGRSSELKDPLRWRHCWSWHLQEVSHSQDDCSARLGGG